MGNWYLGNYKKEGGKFLRFLKGGANNEMLGPIKVDSSLCT